MDKMRMVVIGLGVGCIIFAGAAGAAFYLGNGWRADAAQKQTALDQANGKIHRLEADLKKSRELGSKAQQELAALKEELSNNGEAPAGTPGASVAAGTAAAPAKAQPFSFTDANGRSVDFKEMFKGKAGDMIAKNAVNTAYGDLFKDMTLTAQEREQLQQILVENQTKTLRAFADQKEGASNPGQFKDLQSATEAKVKQLLGDDRFKQYTDYTKTLPDRMQIKQFESMAALSTPLKPEQKKQMIDVMADERQKFDAEMKAVGTPSAASPSEIAEYQQKLGQRLSNRLGTVLSPEQLTQYNNWQESMNQILRSMSAKPAATAPAEAAQ